MNTIQLQEILNELWFRTSRSGGSGGQHVNKVSSKVELLFSIPDSKHLSEVEKQKLFEKLKTRISKEGILRISCEESRSQTMNKELAIEKFQKLISKCLEKTKKRIATKPTKSMKEKRLKKKRMGSEKKRLRGKGSIEY